MAPGSAQQAGCSCYDLGFGGAHLRLTANVSLRREIPISPRVADLLHSPYLEGVLQITRIFIPHAHNDHIPSACVDIFPKIIRRTAIARRNELLKGGLQWNTMR